MAAAAWTHQRAGQDRTRTSSSPRQSWSLELWEQGLCTGISLPSWPHPTMTLGRASEVSHFWVPVTLAEQSCMGPGHKPGASHSSRLPLGSRSPPRAGPTLGEVLGSACLKLLTLLGVSLVARAGSDRLHLDEQGRSPDHHAGPLSPLVATLHGGILRGTRAHFWVPGRSRRTRSWEEREGKIDLLCRIGLGGFRAGRRGL